MKSLFQLSNFRNLFIFLIVFISISLYYFIHINHINKNDMIARENVTLLFILFFVIGFIFKRIVREANSQASLYFVGAISFISLIQIIIVYLCEYLFDDKKEKEKKKSAQTLYNIQNDIKKTMIVLFTSVSFASIALYALPNMIPNLNQVPNIFERIMNDNFTFLVIFFILTIIYRYSFSLYYSNNAKSSLFVPTIVGLPVLLSVFVFIIFIGKNLKMIDWKNYLTTFVVFVILLSLFFYIWIYIFMTSIDSICKDKKKKEKSVKDKETWLTPYLTPLLLISIFSMLWIHDSKKWNRMECLTYLIISIILITSFTTLSTDYPSSSTLTLWLGIEWFLVTYYNWLNVKNSFHCIFTSN